MENVQSSKEVELPESWGEKPFLYRFGTQALLITSSIGAYIGGVAVLGKETFNKTIGKIPLFHISEYENNFSIRKLSGIIGITGLIGLAVDWVREQSEKDKWKKETTKILKKTIENTETNEGLGLNIANSLQAKLEIKEKTDSRSYFDKFKYAIISSTLAVGGYVATVLSVGQEAFTKRFQNTIPMRNKETALSLSMLGLPFVFGGFIGLIIDGFRGDKYQTQMKQEQQKKNKEHPPVSKENSPALTEETKMQDLVNQQRQPKTLESLAFTK